MSSNTSLRQFIFSLKRDNGDLVLPILIEETISPQYHAFVWPCGVVLGQYITWWYINNHKRLASLFYDETAIIEIGAGCSLPSLLFTKLILADKNKLGKIPRFVATDGHAYFKHFSKQLESICSRNTVDAIERFPLSWGRYPTDLPETILHAKRKILLCADCFYDSEDFDDVVVTISHLLNCGRFGNDGQPSPLSECWCTVQIRSTNHNIGHLLNKWQLTFESVPLETFGANSCSLAGSNLPGQSTVEMYIFKPKKSK